MAECIENRCDVMNQMSSCGHVNLITASVGPCILLLRSPKQTIFVIYSLVMTVICIDIICCKIDK